MNIFAFLYSSGIVKEDTPLPPVFNIILGRFVKRYTVTNLIDLHYSNYNNSEDFWFYLNNVAICFQKYNFANPTGQWSLRVPLPLRFQDKNSFLSFVNSNAPGGKSLCRKL